MGRNKENIVGKRFGKLLVIKASDHKVYGTTLWDCICDCGKYTTVYRYNLIAGKTKSCGCSIGRELHGMYYTPEYKAYTSAKSRCTNTNDPCFKHYGGRGIKFCFESFEQFYKHIGKRPSVLHSLDRINNNGHYEVDNVRWATKQEQSMNRRYGLDCYTDAELREELERRLNSQLEENGRTNI